MPLYSIQGPDGRTYSIEGPPGATREQVIRAIQARMQEPAQAITAPPAPQPEESGIFRQALDIPLQVVRGGVGGIRMLADLFGAGSSASEALKSADTWLADLLSSQAKNDQRRIAEILKEAEDKGALAQIGAGLRALATAPADTLAQALGSTAPVIIAGLASGPVGTALGVARAGAVAMPAVGAAMGVGEVKGSIYEAVEQAYKEKGASDEIARAKALEAQSYASSNLPSMVAAGGLGAIAGGMGIERPLTSMLSRGAVKDVAEQQALRDAERGLLSRVGLGALQEGAPEFAQAGQSQLAQNMALRNEGFDVPLFRNVFGAGAMEGAAGAILGGGLAVPRTGVERLPGQQEGESDSAFARRMSREIEAARRAEQPLAPVTPPAAPTEPVVSTAPEGEDVFRLPDGSVGTLDQARAYAMSLPPEQRASTLQSILAQRVPREKTVPPDLFTQPAEKPAEQAAEGAAPTKPLPLATVETAEKPATEISEQAKPTETKPAQAETKEEEQAAADEAQAEQTSEQHAVAGYPVIELPLAELMLSKDVPQFKSDADAKGVVEALGGTFDRRGVAPIQVWKRNDGRMEVISGRHRLDLAQRSGEQTIPAQIHEEATGFDAKQAAMLDAELNIRDQQGKVKDYVAYFENAGIPEADADARGLLARAPGKQGFAIATKGSPELVAAHRADVIPDAGAAAIANAAPGDSRLQAVGIKAIQEGKSPLAAVNIIKAVQEISKGRPAPEGGDLFGFDDSAMREAEEMAKIATLKQNQIAQRLAAISGASRRPEIAKKEGIDIKDPEALKKREKELRQQKASWDNWSSSPDLVQEIRKEMEPAEKPEEKPSVREAEPKELPKDVEAKIDALGKALQRILTRYGLKDVGLRLVADMKAEGEYASKVLSLALDATDPVVALRHESIHAMKELGFFSPAQWKSLERQAKEKWVDQYLKKKNVNRQPIQEGQLSRYDAYMKFYGGDQEAILEEAIADAFADFSATKAPPGMLQALLKKIQNFFQAIKEAFGAEPDAERIFKKAERGELRGKEVASPEVAEAEEAKPSLRVVEGKEKPDLGKSVTVDTVGKYFDDQVVQQFGGKLNYNNPEHFNRAVQQAIDEVKYQIKQKNSGLDWYEEDVQKAFKDTVKVLPQLKKEDNRILFSVMAGIMSPETNARDNWFIAAKAFEHYVNTGDIPGVNPENGNLWMGGTQSANKKIQLEFLDRMVKDLGVKKAVRWLLSPQLVKDINQYRAKYGLLKSGIGGKAMDLKPNGLFAFGEKIGPFISNLNGIHDVTVDKWFTRTFNRYFGTMIGPDGKIVNAPTEPQRRVVKELANRVAKDAGIKNYQVQSLLWFYEQRLFTQLGAQSPSYGFSDGSKKFLDARGKGAVPSGAVPAEQARTGRAKPSLRETIDVDGTERPTTSSTNKPIYPTEEGTKNFWRWFKDSAVVDDDGRPLVVYHGTGADVAAFAEGEIGSATDAGLLGTGFYFTPNTDLASTYANQSAGFIGGNANVIPAYLSIQKPFFSGGGSAPLELMYRIAGKRPENMSSPEGRAWAEKLRNGLIERGYDGIIDSSGNARYANEIVAFNPAQIKSAIGNVGKFDPVDPNIKASLRDVIDPAIRARIDQTTTPREEKSFIKRITEAIAPKSASSFRAAFLDRYNRLSEYDKELARQMGGAPLLADASSHSAALMSDLSAGVLAGAMGVHDGVGGIPVYVNGYTKIVNNNNTVKGPIAIFAPLAKLGDPTAYQAYQFWAGVKRGTRFDREGREQLFEKADIQKAEDLRKQFLAMGVDFEAIQKEWIQFNNGLVKYLKDTGVLTEAAAKEFVKYSDYIPFYRQADGEETVGPQVFASLSGVRAPKKLKGSETPIAEFLETVVRNVQYSIEAGMKNVAAQRAVNTAVAIGQANRLNYVSSAPNVVKVLENGKTSYYETKDMLFVEAMKSLNLGDLPFIGLLAGPANLLRNLVTKDPAFMLANMMRDSMSAWVSSGVKMTPMVDTLTNFTKALRGQNPEYAALLNSGVIGGYDYSQGVEISAQRFDRALRKEAGVYTPAEKLARPFVSLWDALEKGTTASDAATRMEIYKKTLAATGNEAEALFRAVEVMNFNRKGNNPMVRVLTAAVPFLNARMQGLDVLYRAAFGRGTEANAKEIQKSFFIRGMTIAALSTMYWMLASEDDEWKRQEQETRDNYWILGDVKIPIPFEIGVLFKVIPERILEYSFGDDTGKDFLKSMSRQLTSTLSFNPIPQTALPLIESVTNYSFFTGRPIVSQGLEDVNPAYQIAPGTSRIGELIGGATKDLPTALQISPVKIDEMIRGYTGTIGGYMMDLFDAIYDMNTDAPKAAKRFEQMPVIRRFAVDPLARGQVTAYYELKNSVDEAVRTANLLERNMKPQEWGEFMQENMGLLGTKDFVLDLEKSMKQYREMKNFVRASTMDAEGKKDIIANITELENNLASNIQEIKKMIDAQ